MRIPRALRLVNHRPYPPAEAVTPLTEPITVYARRHGTAGLHFRVSEPLSDSIVLCSDWPVRVLTFRAVLALRGRCRTYSAGVGVTLPLSAFLSQIFAKSSLAGVIQADYRGSRDLACCLDPPTGDQIAFDG